MIDGAGLKSNEQTSAKECCGGEDNGAAESEEELSEGEGEDKKRTGKLQH